MLISLFSLESLGIFSTVYAESPKPAPLPERERLCPPTILYFGPANFPLTNTLVESVMDDLS